jgi:putative ABC transport system ATP-binding protein
VPTDAVSPVASARATLGRSMRSQRGRIVAASMLFVGHQAGEASVPLLVGVVIDRAVAGGQPVTLLLSLGVLAADFAALSLCWRFGDRVGTQAGLRAERAQRLAVTRRVLHDRGVAGPRLLPGELVSTATADVRRTASVNILLPHGIAAAAGALVAGVALVVVSLPLGLLIMVGVPLLLGIARMVSTPLERRGRAQQATAARAAGVAVDLVRGVRVLKGLSAVRAGTERYRRTSRESFEAGVHTARAEAGYGAVLTAVTGLFLAVVALVGGRLAASGGITVGQLVASVGLAQFLLGPVGLFGEILAALATARASAGRVGAVLALPFAVAEGRAHPTGPVGRIDAVALRGPGLDGVDLHVERGEIVGVLATDPVAAETLRAYLARDADPAGGSLALDGVAFPSYELAALRRAVLVGPHDPDLFTGSVTDNVGAGPGFAAAARVATVDQVADALPGGLDTAVAERGRSLSGGQRQRIALARALARDPAVLVLHDPTTAVDSVTEAAIAAGLAALRAGRTTILVTTSPALLAVADRVVFVDRGEVAATGTHPVLMRTVGAYRAAVT